MPRRYRLNPCDYLYFAHHNLLRQRGQLGNMPFMTLDVDADLDPAAVETAVERTIEAHPILKSRARISRLSGRPYWSVSVNPDQPAFISDDLRGHTDWLARAELLNQERFVAGWDVYQSPQFRLELFRGAAGRSRLYLRWPHGFMDAEGAQWLLHEIDRLAAPSPVPPAAGLLPDDELVDVLRDRGWIGKYLLFLRGRRNYFDHGSIEILDMADGPPAGIDWRFSHRIWTGDAWAELRGVAHRWCPDGPARFSRYLGACVLRALHRMARERGAESDAYLVTLPMRLRGIRQRPLPGNYLVSATLVGRRDAIDDKPRLLAELESQVRQFVSSDNDLANWALISMAGLFRERMYRWFLGRPGSLKPYAAGFSFYGEIDPPLRTFLGARITNFRGNGAMAAPPGLNPVFSRFGDTLNLSLAWLAGHYTPATAAHLLELIEDEMFDRKVAAAGAPKC